MSIKQALPVEGRWLLVMISDEMYQIAGHVAYETTSSSPLALSESTCPIVFFIIASHLMTGKLHSNRKQIELFSLARKVR